jgi:transposase-like protein
MLARIRAMSVAEQYQAVLDVIYEGRTVMDVAGQWGVNRRRVHRWLAKYEARGLQVLPDRSHRPERCPHQMAAELEVRLSTFSGSQAQRKPIKESPSAKAIDDSQEPWAKLASATDPVPPCAQRRLLHDIPRLLRAPTQLPRQ